MDSSLFEAKPVNPPSQTDRPDRTAVEDEGAPRQQPEPQEPQPPPPISGLEIRLLRRMLKQLGDPGFRVVFWNGYEIDCRKGPPFARVHIRDRRTLWKLFADPGFQFPESISQNRLVIEGDLVEFFRSFCRSLGRAMPNGVPAPRLTGWLDKVHRNTLSGSRENIYHHYDIGNDFYRLWLDENLVYTCAYFSEDTFSLEQAQIAKMNHVCRKLWLKPGETVIEAGCGWGALALHMAKHYGVKVRSYNISREQIDYARRRAKAEGLDGQVDYINDDWRNISGRCDAFVSVGMLEHVGEYNYRRLGEVIRHCLDDHGRGLIHSIGRNIPRPFDRWIERRIFPGAYPPTLREMMPIFETNGLSVLDVENLRLHYAETLRHWLERFEQSAEVIREMFDERFVRMWRLYLAGSCAVFEVGGLQLFQVVFSGNRSNAIPSTRNHQYLDAVEPQFRKNGE